MASYTYVGGYSQGNTTMMSTLSPKSITQIGIDDDYAITIAQMSSAGTPVNLWKWHMRTSDFAWYIQMLEPMADEIHLAVSFVIPSGSNVTLHDGTQLSNPLPPCGTPCEDWEQPSTGRTNHIVALVKFRPSDGAVVWAKTYPSSRGTSVSLASGDSSGNMVRRVVLRPVPVLYLSCLLPPPYQTSRVGIDVGGSGLISSSSSSKPVRSASRFACERCEPGSPPAAMNLRAPRR